MLPETWLKKERKKEKTPVVWRYQVAHNLLIWYPTTFLIIQYYWLVVIQKKKQEKKKRTSRGGGKCWFISQSQFCFWFCFLWTCLVVLILLHLNDNDLYFTIIKRRKSHGREIPCLVWFLHAESYNWIIDKILLFNYGKKKKNSK